MAGVTFRIETEPFGKQRHQTGKGNQYTPTETKRFENMVRAKCLEAMRRQGVARLDGALKLTLTVYFTIPDSYSRARAEKCYAQKEFPTKKPDYDNLAKTISDAIQDRKGPDRGLFKDDCQIVLAVIEKLYGLCAETIVTVEEMCPSRGASTE